MLLKAMRDRYSMAVVTNDIYTREDALILNRVQAISEDRIVGVETGGCPHTAIREDVSLNLAAIADLNRKHPDLDVVLIESGGDNLAATFSPDLADITIYVISVAQGEKIPRKGGPAITKSDLLVITHTDLAPYVNASLEVMEADTQTRARGPALCVHRHAAPREPRRDHRLHRARRRLAAGGGRGIGDVPILPDAAHARCADRGARRLAWRCVSITCVLRSSRTRARMPRSLHEPGRMPRASAIRGHVR